MSLLAYQSLAYGARQSPEMLKRWSSGTERAGRITLRHGSADIRKHVFVIFVCFVAHLSNRVRLLCASNLGGYRICTPYWRYRYLVTCCTPSFSNARLRRPATRIDGPLHPRAEESPARSRSRFVSSDVLIGHSLPHLSSTRHTELSTGETSPFLTPRTGQKKPTGEGQHSTASRPSTDRGSSILHAAD